MDTKVDPAPSLTCSATMQRNSVRLFKVYLAVAILVGLYTNSICCLQAQSLMPVVEMVPASQEHHAEVQHHLQVQEQPRFQSQHDHEHQLQHESQVQPQIEPHQQQGQQDQAQSQQHPAQVQQQAQHQAQHHQGSHPQVQVQTQPQPQLPPLQQQQTHQHQSQAQPQQPQPQMPTQTQTQLPMQPQQQQPQQQQPQQPQQPQPQQQQPQQPQQQQQQLQLSQVHTQPQIQTQPPPTQIQTQTQQQHAQQSPQPAHQPQQSSQPQQLIQPQQPPLRLQQPQQQQPQPQRPLAQPSQTQPPPLPPPPPPPQIVTTPSLKYQPSILSPLYLGHNPFIEILRPLSYADDNIVTLNLSHSHIYEIDSDAFVGQRFEHIDLSNNKLGLIHSRSFRIGPNHSRHTPFDPRANSSSLMLINKHNSQQQHYATRRPPPAHPKSVTIDLSHNPAIVALSGAFDHIDVPNCLLNFTNSTVELKFGAFKKYFKEHPGHLIDIDTVDCCDQEWLLGYKHNFVARTHCAHDPNLYLLKVAQQTIIDSCIAYVTSARHSMTMPSSGIIHSAATNGPRHSSSGHGDNQQYLTYLILGGTAMILTSLSIYIIFYMFSLKAAFVNQMQTQKS